MNNLSKHCKNCKHTRLLLEIENQDGSKFTFTKVNEFVWCTKLEHPIRYNEIACSHFKSIYDHEKETH